MNPQHIPGFTNPNMPIPMPQQSQPINQQQPVSVSQSIPSSAAQSQQFASQAASVTSPFPIAPQTQTTPQPITSSPPKSHLVSPAKPEEEITPSGDVPG